eukprot:Skav222069  [mRNA]  locus=scaffold707:322029:322796:- [translate_table: standard]
MEVNYLSHFLLTNLLLPVLRSSSPSRIINVACQEGAVPWCPRGEAAEAAPTCQATCEQLAAGAIASQRVSCRAGLEVPCPSRRPSGRKREE